MKFFSTTTEIDSYQIQKLEGFNLKEACFLVYYARVSAFFSLTSHNLIP